MTTPEDVARELLDQAQADQATHPIGVTKHRIRRIANLVRDRFDQTNYAMTVLLQRLLDEGYVRDDRQQELRERATNLGRDRGFLTDAEVQQKQAEEELLS